MKAKLAAEFVDIREQINDLRRREKVLREYFVEDMEKFGVSKKKYGDVFMAMFEHQRESVDLDELHKNYPEVFNEFLSTYMFTVLKARRG